MATGSLLAVMATGSGSTPVEATTGRARGTCTLRGNPPCEQIRCFLFLIEIVTRIVIHPFQLKTNSVLQPAVIKPARRSSGLITAADFCVVVALEVFVGSYVLHVHRCRRDSRKNDIHAGFAIVVILGSSVAVDRCDDLFSVCPRFALRERAPSQPAGGIYPVHSAGSDLDDTELGSVMGVHLVESTLLELFATLLGVAPRVLTASWSRRRARCWRT
jgi:hypothetical protein